MALWHACMKMRRGYCTKYALNVDIDHSTVVRKSCVVEVVVVLRRLFIANSRAKCDRRRDYDRRRRCVVVRRAATLFSQTKDVLYSALYPFVSAPELFESAAHEAVAAALIPSPITHLVHGVCDSCFAVVDLIVSWCHKMLLLAFVPFRARRLFPDFSPFSPYPSSHSGLFRLH